ncbi:MAG: putative enoyl-CoA hydratase echA8 [Pelotomaculum sp. PtaB.Bin104]|nr:MAG: putative enoyl-CoA hydratase echA8 [Pelotomaculum sp. PtaB.Bin104]
MAENINGPLVQLNIDNGIVTVAISAPPVNALSRQVVSELRKNFADLSEAPIKAIILTGQGERCFCAGADIRGLADNSAEENRAFFAELYGLLSLVENINCPVIAAVNGYAIGAGLELALCADIRVMDERAQMAMTGANLGLVFCTQRLSRLVGSGRCKELIFTARRVGAAEASQLGLVEYVIPAGQVLDKAWQLAQTIAQKAPAAVLRAKQAINAGLNMTLDRGLFLEFEYLAELLDTEDFHRRVDGFLKRGIYS